MKDQGNFCELPTPSRHTVGHLSSKFRSSPSGSNGTENAVRKRSIQSRGNSASSTSTGLTQPSRPSSPILFEARRRNESSPSEFSPGESSTPTALTQHCGLNGGDLMYLRILMLKLPEVKITPLNLAQLLFLIQNPLLSKVKMKILVKSQCFKISLHF